MSGSLLVCGASGPAVHRLSGEVRRYFERVARGGNELPDDQVTSALVAVGVITPIPGVGAGAAADAPMAGVPSIERVSRRRAMALGAAAHAAAGVVTVGLPSAAAAESPGPDPDAPGPDSPDPDSFPTAPRGGTAGGTGGDCDPDNPEENTNRFTLYDDWIPGLGGRGIADVTWEVVTSVSPLTFAPVTFSYRLEAPPDTQRESATATGTSERFTVVGVESGSPYIWYLTGSNGSPLLAAPLEGVQKILTGNFPPDPS